MKTPDVVGNLLQGSAVGAGGCPGDVRGNLRYFKRLGLFSKPLGLFDAMGENQPSSRLQDVSQGLLCAVECVPNLVIEPVVLKQALDFEQLGEDGIAVDHPGTVDDSLRVRRWFPKIPTATSHAHDFNRNLTYAPLTI